MYNLTTFVVVFDPFAVINTSHGYHFNVLVTYLNDVSKHLPGPIQFAELFPPNHVAKKVI